jgi:hypothetical protein
MATTIDIDDDEVVSVTRFVSAFEGALTKYGRSGDEALLECAPLFRQLLNDKRLITERLNTELRAGRDFQKNNLYSGQVLLLHIGAQYIIRANVWEPVRKYASSTITDDPVYSYLDVHDHNFSFLTGGYYGPGYDTVIWAWKNSAANARIGDSADLELLERTSLPTGRMMMYRASYDVHRQEHAPEFSMSLNVLMRPPIQGRLQYRFDTETARVIGCSSMNVSERNTLCDLAGYLGDDRTLTLLGDIATSHEDHAFRGAALRTLEALGEVSEDDASDLLSRLDLDFTMPPSYIPKGAAWR